MGLFDKIVTIVNDTIDVEKYTSLAEESFYEALDSNTDDLQEDLPNGALIEDLELRDKKVSILLEYYMGSTPSLEISFHIYVSGEDAGMPIGYYTVFFDNSGEIEDDVLVFY